jgi:hypothetical protein
VNYICFGVSGFMIAFLALGLAASKSYEWLDVFDADYQPLFIYYIVSQEAHR